MKVCISNGLKISTTTSYVRFVEGASNSISNAGDGLTLTITFIPGTTSQDISRLSSALSLIENKPLETVPVCKIVNSICKLENLSLLKLEVGNHVFRQFIVKDLLENVKFEVSGCTTLLLKPNISLADYISLLVSLTYLTPLEVPTSLVLGNYNVNIPNRDISASSVSTFQFSSKEVYTKYLLSTVDVIYEWKNRISSILKTKSIDLVAITANKYPATEAYVSYKINEAPLPIIKKVVDSRFVDNFEVKSVIELEIRTVNLVILDWFRHNYNNIEFLSNLTSFYVTDSLGKKWRAACMWSPLPTDFQHSLESVDSNNKHAFALTFTCDVYYYLVKDNQVEIAQNTIKSVVLEIASDVLTESRKITYDLVLDKYDISSILTKKFLVLNSISLVNNQLVLATDSGDRYVNLGGFVNQPSEVSELFQGVFNSSLKFDLPSNAQAVLTLGVESDAYVDPKYYTANFTTLIPTLSINSNYLGLKEGDRYWGVATTQSLVSSTSGSSSGGVVDPYQFITKFPAAELIPTGRALVRLNQLIYLFDPNNLAHINRFIGISTSSVNTGIVVPIMRTGNILNPSFLFEDGMPIFIHSQGVVNTTPSMEVRIVQKIGIATSRTSFVIQIESPIIRAT